MTIIDTGLKFNSPLKKRGLTTAIIAHHTEWENATVEDIHRLHQASPRNWSGIGYNFYIRKNGKIYNGRGWDTVGAHAGSTNGFNSKSVGIAFEGNYDYIDREMPEAQYAAGVWLMRETISRYGPLEILKHLQVADTDCPGQYFPFDQMKKEAAEVECMTADEALEKLVAAGIITSPEYWERALDVVKYLDSLMIKFAEKLD